MPLYMKPSSNWELPALHAFRVSFLKLEGPSMEQDTYVFTSIEEGDMTSGEWKIQCIDIKAFTSGWTVSGGVSSSHYL